MVLYPLDNKHTPLGGDWSDTIDAKPRDDARVREPRNMLARLQDAMQQYFTEMTKRPHSYTRQQLIQQAEAKVILIDTTDLVDISVSWDVWLHADKARLRKDKYAGRVREAIGSGSVDVPKDGRITLADVMKTLDLALADLSMSRGDKNLPPPVFANAYQHIRIGGEILPSKDLTVTAQLTISSGSRTTPLYFKRSWLLDMRKDRFK